MHFRFRHIAIIAVIFFKTQFVAYSDDIKIRGDKKAPAEKLASADKGDNKADDKKTDAKQSAAQQLNAQQAQRTIKLALNEFRGSRANREKALQRALSVGPAGAEAILGKIDEQMKPLLATYLQTCQKLAKAEYTRLSKSVNAEEVTSMRNKILDLVKIEDLKKEQIVETDPIIKKLADLLVLDRDQVLANSKLAQKQRGDLMQFAPFWETCQAVVIAAAAQDPDEKTKPTPVSFDFVIQTMESITILAAGPITSNDGAVLISNLQQSSMMNPEEFRCLADLNMTRLLLGLNALAYDKKLMDAGRDHSEDMAKLKFFAHESPVEGKKTPWDRAKRFDTEASGENIYHGSGKGADAHLAWYHSPGHFKNQLGAGHKRVGIGRYKTHWTQMFGR